MPLPKGTAIFLALLVLAVPALAQTVGYDRGLETHIEYLEQMGLASDYSAISASILDGIARDYQHSVEKYREYVGMMTAGLLMCGYTSSTIAMLREQSVDIEKLVRRHPTQLSIAEMGALSEVAVIAEVIEHVATSAPRDGYRSSVVLEVDEVLRGDVRGRHITLRRRSGPTANGRYLDVSTDFDGDVGERFVFFLSNGVYMYTTRYTTSYNEIVDPDYVSLDPDANSRYISLYSPIPIPRDPDKNLMEALDEARRVGEAIREARSH
ncbi:MAG: hypothetical protein AAF970_09335 [Bacteroidota bacterium]